MRIRNKNSLRIRSEFLPALFTLCFVLGMVSSTRQANAASIQKTVVQKTCESLFQRDLQYKLATEDDFREIIRIANQHRDELGQVLKHNLKVGIAEESLVVARDNEGAVVGFVLWHRRQDGWSTIYDVAVARESMGRGIGHGLMEFVPAPRQLKTTASNESSRNFYRGLGFTEAGSSLSRKGRELILYRDSGKPDTSPF